MRGDDPQQAAMFSYLSPEERLPHDQPLWKVCEEEPFQLANISTHRH
jgi:hypothetical protein